MSRPEVRFIDGDVVRVGRSDLDALEAEAVRAPLGRARLCLRRSTDDPVQEMAIAFTRGSYVRPLVESLLRNR